MLCMAFAGACGSKQSTGGAKADKPCERPIDNVTYFLGTASCLETLPLENLTGYWVTGHEYSVFYRDPKSIPRETDAVANEVWLETGRLGPLDGRRRVFEVSFIGVYSDRIGFYGNGAYKRGAYAKRFTRVKEIRQP